MAVTLNDIKVGRADKVDRAIIDEFIRKSELLASLPFDDAISPNGGSTMTYGYLRVETSPAAEGRAINSDYTAAESKKEKKFITAYLGDDGMLRYNSKLPIVVYTPENVDVKYRIWKAEDKIQDAVAR